MNGFMKKEFKMRICLGLRQAMGATLSVFVDKDRYVRNCYLPIITFAENCILQSATVVIIQ